MELRLRSALAELEAIYEIGPCFRQDLPDRDHSPEFQMLEIFWRKSDFGELCDLTRNLLSAAFGIPVRSFEYIDVGAALEEACPGLDLTFASHEILEAIKIRYPRDCSGFTRTYDALNWLIDKTVVCSDLGLLERPAMLVNYPLATVCLAKPQSSAPHLIERMEVFIDGLEICHGFVDDCDPDRVERRMNENGPQFFDPSFLELMRANRTPPSSGVGFGLERLLMLAGSINHIRDCLHEPQFHSREPLQ
jgi:lysyl-tRNA synthetase class 2